MSFTLMAALVAAITILLFQFLSLLYKHRTSYKDFPQPKRSFLWGHLKVLSDAMGSLPKGGQIDIALQNLAREIGNPPIMFLDLWPINHPMAIINNHELAEQVSRPTKQFPHSAPKSTTMEYLTPLLGPHALVTLQASEWKALRKRFNPGFAPQHLLSLLPAILDKVGPFLAHLDRLAGTGETARLGDYATSLTFDVIGKVTMDMDLGAQRGRGERHAVMNLYVDLVDSYKAIEDTPIAVWLLHPMILARQRRLAREIEPLLEEIVKTKYAEMKTTEAELKTKTKAAEEGEEEEEEEEGEEKEAEKKPTNPTPQSRSVLSLSLQNIPHLTPTHLSQTTSNLKTFLFAGHDTTSILLQWCLYELERSPHASLKLRAELDALFGPDPDPAVVMDALRGGGEDLMARMVYTSAFMKEVLRLYPPGGSARRSEEGAGFVVGLGGGDGGAGGGERYCLDGMVVYNCATTIQRDEKVYGPTAGEFIPERWIGDSDTSMRTNSADADADADADGDGDNGTKSPGGMGRVPASAWRPFERGPRNCIGQELANMETKIILACVARRYEFVKCGVGAMKRDGEGRRVLGSDGHFEVESELYSSRQVTAKPVDGLMGKVEFRKKS